MESYGNKIKTDSHTNSMQSTSESVAVDSARDIWIYGDLRNQSLFDTSLNVLCGAGELAKSMKSRRLLILVLSGDDNKQRCNKEAISKDRAIEQALDYGVDRVFVIDVRTDVNSYSCRSLLPDAVAKILADMVRQKNPAVFLFPLNSVLREISARCAFLCHAGMIADCQRIKYEKSQIVAVCPSHGGEIMAELGFSDSSKTGFITVQPNAFKKELVNFPNGGDSSSDDDSSRDDHSSRDGDSLNHVDSSSNSEYFQANQANEHKIETITVNLPEDSHSSLLKRLFVKKDKSEEQSLENADKVVAGGAGLGNIEGFRNLRKLAAALGAQVGATRPPVLWHWTDDERLIGQTGKSICPELLITVGTSGAVQYTAGITDSKTVVAINKDPNAPIFRFADIGIVEDAAVFVPLLTEKIQKIALRALADSLKINKDGLTGNKGGAVNRSDNLQNSLQGENSQKSENSQKNENSQKIENGEAREQGTDFGSKLMQMRTAHQLTHEDLAQRTGRTPEFIEDLENNRTTPSVGFMIKLSEVFG
ncbi:MAG: helix-turn-helix domain-containing protein, partial [Desulfamplus sp.]|nr:helix-turn-helix domain-containing protein [Desulfamplus sp.]